MTMMVIMEVVAIFGEGAGTSHEWYAFFLLLFFTFCILFLNLEKRGPTPPTPIPQNVFTSQRA